MHSEHVKIIEGNFNKYMKWIDSNYVTLIELNFFTRFTILLKFRKFHSLTEIWTHKNKTNITFKVLLVQ